MATLVALPIFQPGEVCGGSYAIERLYGQSRAAEMYLAQRVATRQRVLLTCARFPSGSRIQSSFLSNASKLTALSVEGAPRILAADVTQGVTWAVREHDADAIPIWEFLTAAEVASPRHAKLKASLLAAPGAIYAALIVAIGARVADVLSAYSKQGIYHGALDPSKTIALGSDGEPLVLDAGYGLLFGPEHFEYAPELQQLTAPELHLGHEVSARSDIFTLGLTLQVLLTQGLCLYKFPPPEGLIAVLSRLSAMDPERRVQRWDDVYALFEELANGGSEAGAEEAAPVTARSAGYLELAPAPPVSTAPLSVVPWIGGESPPVANDVEPPVSSSEGPPAASEITPATGLHREPALLRGAFTEREGRSAARRFVRSGLAALAALWSFVVAYESLIHEKGETSDQSAHVWVASLVERSLDPRAPPRRSTAAPPRPLVAGPRERGSSPSGARNTLDWATHTPAEMPVRRLKEE